MHRKRLFLILFGVLILLVLTVFFITNLVSTNQNPNTNQVVKAATLSFDQNITITESQTFDVAVVLDTGGQDVIGTDVVIEFDETSLTLLNITPKSNDLFKTFTPIASDSASFDEQRVTDSANSKGEIKFGALAFDPNIKEITGKFTGTINPLAVLTFQVKPTASPDIAPITFRYIDSTSTIDSNVVIISATGLAEDILVQPISVVKISTKAQ